MFFWDEDAQRIKEIHEMLSNICSKPDTFGQILRNIVDKLNDMEKLICCMDNSFMKMEDKINHTKHEKVPNPGKKRGRKKKSPTDIKQDGVAA